MRRRPRHWGMRELRDAYWIGGGSGAGKSTVARQLATRHGRDVFDTDEAMARHVSGMSMKEHPATAAFVAMDADERWVNRSPEVMLKTFPWFHGEGFEFIIEDLLAAPRPVIAEGFRLLPRLVAPILASAHHALWLLPTPEFRRAVFERRRPSSPPWSFVEETSDAETALRKLLDRDRMFTDHLLGSRSRDLRNVERAFGVAEPEPSRPRQDVAVDEGVLTRAEERRHVALGPAIRAVIGPSSR